MNVKEVYKEVQSFLADKKLELDALIIDTDKFIREMCEDLDIPIWEEKNGGKTHTEEYLIIRLYIEKRLCGEIEHRMVFISFGTNISL